MADNKSKPSTGWSDRELLASLLYLVTKNGSVFNYNEGCYPPGRNANGFKQKINVLKNTLRPEWDAMEAGTTLPEGTPTKKPATPRKRKAKTDDEGNAGEVTPKKGRGRPKKNKEPTPEIEDDQEDVGVKSEVKDEDEEI